MSLRIVGGRAGGQRILSPRGKTVRPTGERVREALFNIWGQDLEGMSLLDVFAGSGAISLEALSRNAAKVVAFERDEVLCRNLRSEAERLGLSASLEVHRTDALSGLARLRRAAEGVFDFAFIDPPWKDEALREETVREIFEPPALCRCAVVEAPSRVRDVVHGAKANLVRRARYGDTTLFFLGSN